jgi:hypothetical protein
MKTNGRFFIINEHSDRIKAMFLTVLPILWNRDGEFRVVPKAVVQNAIDNKTMYEKLSDKTISPMMAIMWSQGIPISNLAGRALVGE